MSEFPRWPKIEKDDELTRISGVEETEATSFGEASKKPELKGKLLEQIEKSKRRDAQELSALRGSLVNEKTAEYEPFTIEWLKAQTFIQSDNGKFFTLKDVSSSRKGTLIILKNTVLNQTVTLNLDDFVEKLKSPGGSWRVK